MYAFELCRQYQNAINNGRTEAASALFEPNAVVITPLAGKLGVGEYHKWSLSHAGHAITRLQNVFEGLNDVPSIGLHLHHTRILENGGVVTFEAMNIFELAPDCKRFARLTVIFDSVPVLDILRSPSKMSCGSC
jgi:hypothetical protein